MKVLLEKDKLYFHALFIQPTWDCGLNCKGCYIKSKQGNSEQISSDDWQRIFRRIFQGDISTNQLTMSIDRPPDDPNRTRIMRRALTEVYLAKAGGRVPTKLHFTVDSFKTLSQYWESEYDLHRWMKEILAKTDLLSISSPITGYQEWTLRETNPNLILNWQVQAHGPWNEAKFVSHLENFDQAYFIMHKGNQTFLDASNWFEWLKGMRALPPSIRNKIYLDTCALDTWRYKKTGNGCSANISKAHIWPDGHVTGCPYNQRHLDGQPGEVATVDKVLDNLRRAKERYEFRTCQLMNELTDRPKGIHLPVVK